jgi:hypothetical protein
VAVSVPTLVRRVRVGAGCGLASIGSNSLVVLICCCSWVLAQQSGYIAIVVYVDINQMYRSKAFDETTLPSCTRV